MSDLEPCGSCTTLTDSDTGLCSFCNPDVAEAKAELSELADQAGHYYWKLKDAGLPDDVCKSIVGAWHFAQVAETGPIDVFVEREDCDGAE